MHNFQFKSYPRENSFFRLSWFSYFFLCIVTIYFDSNMKTEITTALFVAMSLKALLQ